MTLLRRFLVLTALMFWQGGFLFCAAVVVPIRQQVLRSLDRQAFRPGRRVYLWAQTIQWAFAVGLSA